MWTWCSVYSTNGGDQYNGKNKYHGDNGFALGLTDYQNVKKFLFCLGNTWYTVNGSHTNRVTFYIRKSTVKINNTSYSVSNTWTFYDGVYLNFYIGASCEDGSAKHFVKEKIYRLKLWNSNSTLIRDFVPALKRSNSKPGLYDVVNKKFYTNKGLGEFCYLKYPVYKKVKII